MRPGPTGKLRTPDLPRAEASNARDLAHDARDWWIFRTWLPSVNGGFKADSQALLNRNGSLCFLGTWTLLPLVTTVLLLLICCENQVLLSPYDLSKDR